jgi:hypothetical protein
VLFLAACALGHKVAMALYGGSYTAYSPADENTGTPSTACMNESVAREMADRAPEAMERQRRMLGPV